jgi:hypothetical protein
MFLRKRRSRLVKNKKLTLVTLSDLFLYLVYAVDLSSRSFTYLFNSLLKSALLMLLITFTFAKINRKRSDHESPGSG